MKKTTCGFSLIELTITLALFFLIISAAVVQVNYLQKSVALGELELFATTCQMLRANAIATGASQKLRIDSKKQCYQYGTTVHYLPKNCCVALLPGIKGPPASPIKLIEKPVTFEDDTIVFTPEGMISAGTVYYICGDTPYALSSAVGAVSFLRKYRYNTQWHRCN